MGSTLVYGDGVEDIKVTCLGRTSADSTIECPGFLHGHLQPGAGAGGRGRVLHPARGAGGGAPHLALLAVRGPRRGEETPSS